MTGVTLDAIAWGRATNDASRFVVDQIKCADGFTVSVQASWGHYCHDANGKRPEFDASPIAYPFRSFEVGYPSERPEPWQCTAWREGFDSHEDHPTCDVWAAYGGGDGGIYAFVPYAMVRALLDSHGGEVTA